jgi:hypothetical protein
MLSDLFARLGFGRVDNASAVPMPEMLSVRGVPVELLNSRPDIARADVLARLAEALDLIGAHQPWRLRHLQRDVRAIRVERYACRGAFIPSERVIITELTFLARRDISAAPVASSILHEGVHARVHALTERLAARGGGAGSVYGHDRDAAREERLCRRAELAFGLSLPEALGAPVIERAMASLQLDDISVAPRVDWHEAQRRIDEVDGRA